MNRLLIIISFLFTLTGCASGTLPAAVSDPLCLNSYYDVRTDKFYTPSQMEKRYPGSTHRKYHS